MISWIYDIHPKEQFTPPPLKSCFTHMRVLSEETFNFAWFKLLLVKGGRLITILFTYASAFGRDWDSHSSGSAFRAQRLTNSTASNKYTISEQLLRERNVSVWMIVCLQRSHTHRLHHNGWSLGDIRFGLAETRFSRLGISQACVYLHSLNCSFDK